MAKKTVVAVKETPVAKDAPKKEVEWTFVPLKKGYEGPVAINERGKRILPMVHEVKGRATLCKIDMDVPSKGQTHYGLNWVPVDKPVVCKKCRSQMED